MFDKISHYTSVGIPHIFFISFDKKKCEVLTIEEASQLGIWFKQNVNLHNNSFRKLNLQPQYISFEEYKTKFEKIQYHLRRGDTYLLNLTQKTPIKLPVPIEDVARTVYGKFVGYWPKRFLFFSPEPFVYIDANHYIHTFPMKGTSRGSTDPLGTKLITSEKEQREHATVVDLLRNDLAIVAKNIEIVQYKYLEKVPVSNEDFLWQMSSHIRGKLPPSWKKETGDLLAALLPAGSISGAPKEKTVEIIKETEGYERDFFTGIAGMFDGKELISCVMIRYIAIENGSFYYLSGGGITTLSNVEEEYAEYQHKIYALLTN